MTFILNSEAEKGLRAWRRIATLDSFGYAPILIRISIRNSARGSSIRGINSGPWGRNIRCLHEECRDLIDYNNERGKEARNQALESAGRHLEEYHPEHVALIREKHKNALAARRAARR